MKARTRSLRLALLLGGGVLAATFWSAPPWVHALIALGIVVLAFMLRFLLGKEEHRQHLAQEALATTRMARDSPGDESND